ncbi:E3 SUMO-protein ligase SIZ1-like [Papaver somniferum]|uniref:E3 SUMO-protein ligase SIZ1-like n=1 Tax=Papaver somniferum TaxID=3469 RepID=UPI000E7040ED|nr:E3 SUMO-protein ligase SIZ1-like [Papaver somniferum]XP_026382219.1 E3 SUMO-protein ligase SIZ1-like [Papaver somniferum]
MLEKDKQLEIHRDVLCICRRPSAVRVKQLKCQREGCTLWLHQQCYRRKYCPYCCLEMLNPFCVTSAILVPPTVLFESDEKLVGRGKFRLTPTQQQMVVLPENQIQMWCMRFEDDQSGTQWPLNSFLMVNESPLAMETALSASTHDHCITILDIEKQGTNSVVLMGDPDPKSGSDFCFGVRIGKQLSEEMVSQNIVAESFEGAVDRCIKILTKGGSGADMIQLYKLNLVCPLSRSKVKCPARLRGCQHMSSFDLISFLKYTRSHKEWCCPICNRKYPSFALVLDGFLMPIVSALPENVEGIEVQADAPF